MTWEVPCVVCGEPCETRDDSYYFWAGGRICHECAGAVADAVFRLIGIDEAEAERDEQGVIIRWDHAVKLLGSPKKRPP